MILDQCLSRAQEFLDNGNTISAIEILEKLLPHFENNPVFLNTLGTSYLQINEIDKGIEILNRAYLIDSKSASVLYNLGKAYADCKNFVKAKKYLTSALKYDPNNIAILTSLGATFSHFDKLDKARELFLKALKINSNYAYAHFNIGKLFQAKKDYLNAIKSYEKAIQADPNYFLPYWNKALLKLLLGEFLEGWKLYELRLKKKDTNHEYKVFDERKSWRGEDRIDGKTLLIFGEQGFGDVIQFARYVPLLDKYNCKLILYVKKELVSLLETLGNSITVIGMDKPIPEHDLNCPIMSLPLVFKTDLSNIPKNVPYLSINKNKQEFWQTKLIKTRNSKIGFVFSGSKAHQNDHLRSIEFNQFQALFKDMHSIEFHSLMVDFSESDRRSIKNSNFLISHEDELHDFSDTAALIGSLDMVITVDSVVAHLAGALNKAVWILLPYNADFRWMEGTSNSKWYPSAKLFRQKNRGDWSQPIEEINLALKGFVKAV